MQGIALSTPKEIQQWLEPTIMVATITVASITAVIKVMARDIR
jgi:hypothetical protein